MISERKEDFFNSLGFNPVYGFHNDLNTPVDELYKLESIVDNCIIGSHFSTPISDSLGLQPITSNQDYNHYNQPIEQPHLNVYVGKIRLEPINLLEDLKLSFAPTPCEEGQSIAGESSEIISRPRLLNTREIYRIAHCLVHHKPALPILLMLADKKKAKKDEIIDELKIVGDLMSAIDDLSSLDLVKIEDTTIRIMPKGEKLVIGLRKAREEG